MISLTKIFLHNWHRFNDHVIEVEDSLYLAGHNGSGKSSVLDALQMVLLADLNRVRFNSSAQDKERSKRDLDSYVRGKIGEDRWLRPGNTVAYIALEWTNKTTGECFVSGVVIESGQEGTNRSFFILPAALESRLLIVDGRPRTRRDLKRFLKNQHGTQYYESVGEYQESLLNRLGGLSERFFDLFIRALTFQPIRDIREFVEQWLLDPKPLDVATLNSVVERLNELERSAKEVAEKINALAKISEHQAEVRRTRDLNIQYLVLAALLHEAAADQHVQELHRHQAAQQQQLAATDNDLGTIQAIIKRTADDRVEAEVQLRQSDVVRRRDDLEREIRRTRDEADKIRTTWNTLRGDLAAAAQSLRPLLDDLADSSLPKLVQTIDNLSAEPPPNSLRDLLQATLPALDAALDGQQRSAYQYEAQIKIGRERGQTLEQEIAHLKRQGKVSYPPNVEMLRDLLHEKMGQRPPLLCELLQVPDERWQNAVEAQLGQRRFNVIVPPKQFAEAIRLLDRARSQEKLYEVGLIDLAKAENESREARPRSLALHITTNAPLLRKYINTILGDIITCENVDELRQHRRAITPDVVVYQEWTARAIDPKHYTPWFIGERAGRSQIEDRERELATISTQLAALAPRLQQASDAVARLKRGRDDLPTLAIRHDQPLDDRVLRAHIIEQEQELSTLDLSGVESLRREVERLQAIEVKHRGDAERLMRISATLSTTLEQLERDQRDADRTLHQRQLEAQEQRNRHQAVMPAAESALREQTGGSPDFSQLIRNAEAKSREFDTRMSNTITRLIEAATAYNTQYQFSGIPSNPDDERYGSEHDRLNATDLPRYAEQIAHAKGEAEQELREHVLHRLREEIRNAKQQLDRINDSLKGLQFHGERYRFHYEPASTMREVYDLIMESTALGSGPLFQSEFYAKHQATFDRFYAALTRQAANASEEREQDALADYRRYLAYDIDVTHGDGQRSRLSKIIGQTSGGETQTPFYLTIAASFMQLYRINERSGRPTIRLVAFDEAFSKMDQERIGSTLELFNEFKLQIITATPLERCEYLVPKMCTNLVLTSIRDTVLIEPYRNYAARLDHETVENI